MKRVLCLMTMLSILALGPLQLWAQEFPTHPIRLIVPYAPGGGGDFVARLLAQKLTVNLGQPIVVENRAGAAGRIGSDAVAKAAPDGYTIGEIISGHLVNPALFKDMPYDSINDFAPISQVVTSGNILVVHPSVPVKTLPELIALIKAKPGVMNAVVALQGATSHMALLQMQLLNSLDIVSVIYKGSGNAVLDLLEGRVQMMFSSYPSVAQHIKAGKLRAICVTSAKRSKIAPEIPTCAETAGDQMVLTEWWGFVAPAKTPSPIINRLNREIVAVLAQSDVRQRLEEGLFGEVAGTSPSEFGEFIKVGVQKSAELMRRAGVKQE